MFAGIVTRGAGANPQQWIASERALALVDPYRSADAKGFWLSDTVLLTQALQWTTPEGRHEPLPAQCPETGRVCIGWIRIDNRQELCRLLGRRDQPELSDAALVLCAYRAWGMACAGQLEGDFSFAVHDPDDDTTWCVRDVFGARPFFYHAGAEVFAFAGTAALFPTLRLEGIAPSEAWIARYLLGYSHDQRNTAYTEVNRVPPGHSMVVRRGVPQPPERFFAFEDKAPAVSKRDEDRPRAYLSALDRAVGARLRGAAPIGAELSGGLDSSAVVASAAAQLEDPAALRTFGFSMFAEDPGAQQAVARFCGLEGHCSHPLATGDWEWDTEERALAMLGFPAEHPNAAFHAPLYEDCRRQGIRVLLSGFGGDEIVTHPAREVYQELFDRRQFGALWHALGTSLPNRLRELRRFRRERRGLSEDDAALGSGFLAQLDATPFDAAFRREQDLDAFQQARGRVYRGRSVNDTILNRAFRAYVSGRLESCSAIAASFGVEYRWPLLDRQLVSLYLAIPAIEKRHAGFGRYLHRVANRSRLPDHITWHGKSMGPVLSTASAESSGLQLPDFALLPERLKVILDPLAYQSFGTGKDNGSGASVDFANMGVYRRQLVRRVGLVGRWLARYEDIGKGPR